MKGRSKWSTEPLETNAERLRRLRAAAVIVGRCRVCRARPAKRPYRTCQHCLDAGRKRKRRARRRQIAQQRSTP